MKNFFYPPAGSKTSPATTDGGAGEPDTGAAAGRKRRWGSSTAVTAKKPSISITTDSLKVLTQEYQVSMQAWENMENKFDDCTYSMAICFDWR